MDFQKIVEAIGIPIASGLELFGVLVIGFAFFHAVARAALHFSQGREKIFAGVKVYLGKALQLSLEFLVAADIIRTVMIEPSRKALLLLGLLIVLRTFLSWSITVEIEGRWPWQSVRKEK